MFSAIVAAGTFLIYKSHLWSKAASFCQMMLTHYWLFIAPIFFLGVFVVTVWKVRQTRKKIALFEFIDNGSDKIKVFKSDKALAFTFGFLKPKIYLSTTLINDLSKEELDVVLAHENHHLKKRHHLWSLLLSFIKNSLFFLPIVHWIYDRYRANIEFECDKEAARVAGNSFVVANTILKLGFSSLNLRSAAAASISAGDIEGRIKKLVGERAKKSWKRPLLLSIISLTIFFAIANFALAQQATSCCFKS